MTLEQIAVAYLNFVNYGITIIGILIAYNIIRFLMGPGAADAEVSLEAAGEKIKEGKKSWRKARRAVSKMYRYDKDLKKILADIDKAIGGSASGGATTRNLGKIAKLLAKGREEIEKENEMRAFMDSVSKEVNAGGDVSEKAKLTSAHKELSKNLTGLTADYVELETAVGKKDWKEAGKKVKNCSSLLVLITRDILNLEALQK